jgi:signal transduction histidine kinase
VVLTVADTGPGIPPENLERIFDPLFSTKSFGTGLGLPIVKQIVEQHGGTIRIDSEVAHGTRVRISLPLSADAMPELRRAAA